MDGQGEWATDDRVAAVAWRVRGGGGESRCTPRVMRACHRVQYRLTVPS